jgi:PhnB protein
MPSMLNPYLNFAKDSRQAMEFYKSVFGGDLNISTYAEGGMPHDPSEAGKVMHAQLTTKSGMTLMASDVPARMGAPGDNGNISVSGDNDAELSGYWAKLSDGGTVTMPLTPAPWGDKFGMVTDKFGVRWMVNIAQPKKA